MWLRHDSRFHALAAEDKSLCWDHKLNDLWLECFSLVAASPSHAAAYPSSKAWCPCTYCGAITHYPDNCSSDPFRAPRSTLLYPSPSPSPLLLHSTIREHLKFIREAAAQAVTLSGAVRLDTYRYKGQETHNTRQTSRHRSTGKMQSNCEVGTQLHIITVEYRQSAPHRLSAPPPYFSTSKELVS